MEQFNLSAESKLRSPAEELQFLREQTAETEKRGPIGEAAPAAPSIPELIRSYGAISPAAVLAPTYAAPAAETEAIVLQLTPETHDQKMADLLGFLEERGIKNTLTILAKLGNPHLTDDFERVLVQYLKTGRTATGLRSRSPLARALRMTLFEVSLPLASEGSHRPSLKELISPMEQFYAGMLSVVDDEHDEANYFTLEIAVANHSNEFVFYAAVPDHRRDLFTKQLLAIFPKARIVEQKDDYNVFSDEGVTAAAVATWRGSPLFPLKTYDQFDYDPLNIILNSFSQVDRDGEGAAIQLVFHPVGDVYDRQYRRRLERIVHGEPVKKVLGEPTGFWSGVKTVLDFFLLPPVTKPAAKDGVAPPRPDDQAVVEELRRKLATTIVEANIRLVASAANAASAGQILTDLESAFHQFASPGRGEICFRRLEKKALARLLHNFSFRLFDRAAALLLSLRELASLWHWPTDTVQSAQLKQVKAITAPAPVELPTEGILLGINRYQSLATPVHFATEDRLRHFYAIGQTGTGKSTLLKSMIIQDIQRGEGVGMIDPHGVDIRDVLAAVPKERYEDVIYFDPSYTARPMALNMLEYDARFPEQKTFVVNEMLSIFNKLFDMKVAGGPMFEQYFRNATMLVIENPESGNTLLDVSRVLADKKFRDLKLFHCRNPVVVQFWREVAEKAGGESALANIVPYITSKFDVFLANEIMRPIIAQEHSSFNFREVMDNKKIFLANLAKGRLGDLNAGLIGLILVGKMLMAALSRVDSLGSPPAKGLPPFYLYIDEFQNVTTDSIVTILSEARKYKLGLNIAHQFIAQLTEGIRDAVFGNVGSLAAFRVGADDAEYLEKHFAPIFAASDLINIDNHNAYLRLLIHGRPVKPFNIETRPLPQTDPALVEQLEGQSYLRFGRPRLEIEAEISRRFTGDKLVGA